MHIYRRLKKHSEENQFAIPPPPPPAANVICEQPLTGVTLPPLGQTLDLDWNLYTVLLYKML